MGRSIRSFFRVFRNHSYYIYREYEWHLFLAIDTTLSRCDRAKSKWMRKHARPEGEGNWRVIKWRGLETRLSFSLFIPTTHILQAFPIYLPGPIPVVPLWWRTSQCHELEKVHSRSRSSQPRTFCPSVGQPVHHTCGIANLGMAKGDNLMGI